VDTGPAESLYNTKTVKQAPIASAAGRINLPLKGCTGGDGGGFGVRVLERRFGASLRSEGLERGFGASMWDEGLERGLGARFRSEVLEQAWVSKLQSEIGGNSGGEGGFVNRRSLVDRLSTDRN
jgi:hypothetical protein